MLEKMLANVHEKHPLIECMTNHVTINDVANVILAVKASPVMAEEEKEVADFTSISQGVMINLGAKRVGDSYELIAKTANEKNIPMVFDPVGAGAGKWRTKFALKFIRKYDFTIIRGNVSEIKTLAQGAGSTRGVDVNPEDAADLSGNIKLAEALAKKHHNVVIATGARDIVTDGQTTYLVENGIPEMTEITGTGDQLSGLLATFAAANPDDPLKAALAGTCMMGLAGEVGYSHLASFEGNSTLRNRIIDAANRMTPAELEEGAKFTKQS